MSVAGDSGESRNTEQVLVPACVPQTLQLHSVFHTALWSPVIW
jgi:hypothetical protein